jgi:PHP family Zn ribbon phosphoesterase
VAKQITMDQYNEAREAYLGFCTACNKFTTGCVEPDAHEYECESCGELTVMGVEDALMEELIEVNGD